MIVYYAEFETRHFSFSCAEVAKSHDDLPARNRIQETLLRGLRWHCQQHQVDPDHLIERVLNGDYDLHIRESGVLYRDSWPLGPAGANQHAPGKERMKE